MPDRMTVIFDMDGVIFDSERACLDCWLVLADRYGLQGLEEVFRKCIGTNDAQTIRILEDAYAKDFGDDIALRLRRESSVIFHERYDDGKLPVKPGVRELLDYLKQEGIPTAVASSTKKASVERELTDAGFIGYFDQIIGGDAVKISKPNPEIYLLACSAMHTAPGDAYAVEDSFNGIRSAHAAGMHPIMVPDLIPADDEMAALADHICDSLFDVMDYFKSIRSG